MYYLGTISGMSGAYNNLLTGVSGIGTFKIPAATKRLYLVPGGSGISFELGVATSFQTTAARAAQLKSITGDVINGPFSCDHGPTVVVSAYCPVAGWSVRVYGA